MDIIDVICIIIISMLICAGADILFSKDADDDSEDGQGGMPS